MIFVCIILFNNYIDSRHGIERHGRQRSLEDPLIHRRFALERQYLYKGHLWLWRFRKASDSKCSPTLHPSGFNPSLQILDDPLLHDSHDHHADQPYPHIYYNAHQHSYKLPVWPVPPYPVHHFPHHSPQPLQDGFISTHPPQYGFTQITIPQLSQELPLAYYPHHSLA